MKRPADLRASLDGESMAAVHGAGQRRYRGTATSSHDGHTHETAFLFDQEPQVSPAPGAGDDEDRGGKCPRGRLDSDLRSLAVHRTHQRDMQQQSGREEVGDSSADERKSRDVLGSGISDGRGGTGAPNTQRPTMPSEKYSSSSSRPPLPPTARGAKAPPPARPPYTSQAGGGAGANLEKQRLLAKFKTLRLKYRNADIPEFSLYSSLQEMIDTYNSTLTELKTGARVEKLRRYLKYAFLGMEFLGNRLGGVDMTGFVDHHLGSMSEYDEILAEISENEEPSWLDAWGPTWRLAFIVGQQTLIFLGMRLLGGQAGAGLLASVMGNIGAGQPTGSAHIPPPKPPASMKGPSVNLADL